jgi:two-component system chemotaxis response regulator CheB
MNRIKVLIIDDSALVRRLLRAIFQTDREIEVCGEAPDAYVARELIKQHNPDVLTLDVEMPKMDGLTFLANLMRLRPTPVVMISSLTEAGASVTLDALELGAIDFVAKPKLDLAHGLDEAATEILAKVKMAARAKVNAVTKRVEAQVRRPATSERLFRTTDRIIAIGASTGGTEAIRELLTSFPPDAPGTVITQHIPSGYSRAFAQRLDRDCSVTVCHAEDGQRILPGHAYVAPGGQHLSIIRSGAYWICKVAAGEPVNRHMPSVDVLFQSVVSSAGANATGVLLTGMGDDGARGLLELRKAGAMTICQDEATSVVWGMPGAAVKLGAAVLVLPLEEIASRALDSVAAAV